MSGDDFWGSDTEVKVKHKEKVVSIVSSAKESHSQNTSSRSHSAHNSGRLPSEPRRNSKQAESDSQTSEDDSKATRSLDGSESGHSSGKRRRQRRQGGREGSGGGAGSRSRSGSSASSDPLSDVWDSGDETSADEEEPAFPAHELGSLTTLRGPIEVDVTPPSELLREAEWGRRRAYRKRDSEEAVRHASRILALTKIIYGEKAPWKMAEAEAWLGKVYWELLEYSAQTLYHAEEAKKYLVKCESTPIQPGIVPPNRKEILEICLLTYYLLGKGSLGQGKLPEAEAALRRAERALADRRREGEMRKGGFWATELAAARARLAVRSGVPEDAVPFLEKVERLLCARYGDDDPKLLPLYAEMARVHLKVGEPELALEFTLRHYSIVKANSGEESAELGTAALGLAAAYQGLGPDIEEGEIYAESYLNEAVDAFCASLGKRHAKTLKAKMELAKEMGAKGKSSEAITFLKALQKDFDSTFGDLSMRNAERHRQIATYALQNGDSMDGVKNLKRVLEIESKALGKNHRKSQATAKALSVLLKNPSLSHMKETSKLDERPHFRSAVKSISMISGLSKKVPSEY